MENVLIVSQSLYWTSSVWRVYLRHSLQNCFTRWSARQQPSVGLLLSLQWCSIRWDGGYCVTMLHCYTDAILAVTKEMMMVTDKILACLSGCPTPIPIIQISATVLSTNSIPAQQCNAPLFVFSIAWPSLNTNTILVQMQHNFQPRDVFCSRVWKGRW